MQSAPVPRYLVPPRYLLNIYDIKHVTGHKTCVLFFRTNLSETFLILRRTQCGGIQNVYQSADDVCFMLVIFYRNLNFVERFDIKISSSQWEPNCCMRTDRRTDRINEADSCFSQFCERAQSPCTLTLHHT